ncbi:DUF523 domain-containing protein [Halothermothrix orenii]|uniref:Uncharacterized conserved protein n=1 Tax=Halothermothrix orenii (strain H 168 / OCM 544 / DSM 9562) TaxID=373903 RepID=B8D1I9_HALOH|nr:DUF523 domain-containing protein [Halothermothrix orenii]ACL69066.1 uncharacterized conserved protein [Halothermothrix orenii H 168]
MIIVSACLLGKKCRYDGKAKLNNRLVKLLKDKEIIPVCPELEGDLPVPRPPAEIIGGNGFDILKGRARIKNREGRDVTDNFIKGVNKVITRVDLKDIRMAILKERSPSCGVNCIYDGSFNGKLKDGCGVFTARLLKEKIPIFSEEETGKLINQGLL